MWWCVTVIVVDVFGRCGLGVVDVFGRLGSCFGRWGVWALGMKHEFHDARFVGDWNCICLPHQSRVRMASRVEYGALRSACRVMSSAAIRPSMSKAAQYKYVCQQPEHTWGVMRMACANTRRCLSGSLCFPVEGSPVGCRPLGCVGGDKLAHRSWWCAGVC